MLIYPGKNDYSTSIVGNAIKAIIKLDLKENTFMLGLLADITQANPDITISNHLSYRGYTTTV